MVGPEEEKFTVREGYLRTVRFFDKALGDFKEGKDALIRLPEDLPVVFETFLMWLLRNSVELPANIDKEYLDHPWKLPTEMLKFADKIQCAELMARSCQMFWHAQSDICDEYGDDYVDDALKAYKDLESIRARLLPLHLMIVKFREDPETKYRSFYGTILSTSRDQDFWHELTKYQQLMDMVFDAWQKHDGRRPQRQTRNLIVQSMVGELDVKALFPESFIECSEKFSEGPLAIWLACHYRF